jgi:hypothetical protein
VVVGVGGVGGPSVDAVLAVMRVQHRFALTRGQKALTPFARL